jgi:hypothetical protein
MLRKIGDFWDIFRKEIREMVFLGQELNLIRVGDVKGLKLRRILGGF